MRRRGSQRAGLAGVLLLLALPICAFDLSRAEVTRLANGLTLIVLEEAALPVVSVQMLYTVGARNEPLGQSGIAHYLEHMAFRASEHFPDTEVVSSIYAAGGEWHGYTWLDQTTYFETLPAEDLDLALAIEADRMARLLIPAADVEPERGAVLAEMHGYENDPATVLNDAVLAVSFLEHPYRNNTIGWESDVTDISHEELVEFYRRHYRPANAVLAIVGRVEKAAVRARVEELFGSLPAGPPTAPPPTIEPPQRGERRVEILGGGSRHLFEVAYRAPAAVDADFAPFLVLQDVLAAGRGVNFAQNTFGDPARPGSRLAAVSDDLATWYPPQAAPYVFTIVGSITENASRTELEERLEAAIAPLRHDGPTVAEVAAAQERLADELVFDLETTEDAAHQLAYFAGLGGLDRLLGLPAAVAAVTPADVMGVAGRYLQPYQRTIGWSLAGPVPAPAAGDPVESVPAAIPSLRPTGESTVEPLAPRVLELAGGLPVLFQRLPLSPAAYLRILVPATSVEFDDYPAGMTTSEDDPVWRHTSVDFRFRPEDLAVTLEQAAGAVRSLHAGAVPDPSAVDDPATRLALALDQELGRGPSPAICCAAAIALVGDLDEGTALPLLEALFGDWAPAAVAPFVPAVTPGEVEIELAAPKTQAQLGYVVPAPPPAARQALAWRALLYVVSHGYEGRLGKEAISRRGLLYYIDARYGSDGLSGRVSLEMGVDPDKLEPLRALLADTLAALRQRPPTPQEVAEAAEHFRGRRVTAAQSNEEVSAALLAEWVGQGRLLTTAEFERALESLTADDVARVVPEFLAGVTAVVGVGGARDGEE